MVASSQTHAINQTNRMQAMAAFILQHKWHCGILITLLCACAIYLNPQGFLNLWLTRDQQAMVSFKQGQFDTAARTFTNKNWLAYSYYLNGDYQQAASVYAQLKGIDAQFSQANAWVHARQFTKAIESYNAILITQPDHQAARYNLELVKNVIKKMKKSPGKKEFTDEIMKNSQQVNVTKEAPKEKRMPSHDLWLEQVQQNPAKFLRKKFSKEHANEHK